MAAKLIAPLEGSMYKPEVAEKMPPVESMLMVVPFDEDHLMSAVLALTMADYFKSKFHLKK